ncbi:MFS transporter [Methylosinus sp. Sm6]|uniref:MFS transporter n=1 Tax=Methylosinus sp. Sm6 TaxID=2866948 RepID=UPI001C99A8BA|nr:MFS transporter [Methylosinus sp. Sm6]MBY6242506.1 MFS transporter [Methylosinus sp. Sm6]
MSHDSLLARPSQTLCLCGARGEAGAERGWTRILSLGFGLNVLAQALALSQLPEAARLSAPSLERVGWPLALLLLGAALASLPAALLVDSFGRRAAFALGASLGAAGGGLAAFAIAHTNFPALCLGALWLGLAQGFALFYRHIAAPAGGGLAVLGGGALAALAAPLVAGLGDRLGGGAGIVVSASLAYVASLALALRLPHAFAEPAASGEDFRLDARFVLATGAGAAAWFVMASTMLHGPLTLSSVCGAAPGFVGGATALHLLAMYGPAALAAQRPALFSPLRCVALGLGVMAGAYAVMAAAYSPLVIAFAMMAIGACWSLANIGALRLLHECSRPRAALAAHDLLLLLAAAAGALS